MATNRFARIRHDHSTETAEDYVELVDTLIRERGEARTVDMAERLGVSPATVTNTIQRLQRNGYVRTEPYRSIFLTEKGQQMADEMRERHKVVLRFLLALGVPESVAVLDAEGIEHHVSGHTLDAMRRFSDQRPKSAGESSPE